MQFFGAKCNNWFLNAKRDATKVSECYAAIDFEVGKVDVMVANATGWSSYSYLDVPEEEFDRVINTDLKGACYIGRAVARQVVSKKIKGKIVFISSAAHMGEGPMGLCMNTYLHCGQGRCGRNYEYIFILSHVVFSLSAE